MNFTTIAGLAIALLIVVGLLFSLSAIQLQEEVLSVSNFDECVAAGNPVMESYPEQCRTKDGRLFINERQGVEVPQPPQGQIVPSGCAIAGCSGQLCVSADEADEVFTTCEYRAEYACYENATCEIQSDGQCGWTQTAELTQCLTDPPALDSEGELQAI
jgi:hypothetical protein